MIIIYPPEKYLVPIIGKNADKKALVLNTISGTSNHDTEITSHPVEKGVDITDHCRNKPITASYQVVAPDDLGIYGTGIDIATKTNFSKVVWEYLLTLKNEFVVFEMLTKDGLFKNMMITSLKPTETVETGNTMEFSMDVQEIRIVQSREGLFYEPVNENVAKQITSPVNNGNAPKEEVTQTTAADNNDTVIAEGYNALFH